MINETTRENLFIVKIPATAVIWPVTRAPQIFPARARHLREAKTKSYTERLLPASDVNNDEATRPSPHVPVSSSRLDPRGSRREVIVSLGVFCQWSLPPRLPGFLALAAGTLDGSSR
ncbi:hypothetical protein E2C01_034081 [Portunus trituberculatus]|uniref:Uncharacterized protein n=1 Tax=Portunus trituberculatus TaxID=210409 RepID=A0A5B7F0J0_PORTR|nr:hypothetical protein [Portunus trituberculatus]